MLLTVLTVVLVASASAFNLNVPDDFRNQLTNELGSGVLDPNHVVEQWIQKCGEERGTSIRSKLQEAGQAAQSCITSNINIGTLFSEIEAAVQNKRGELDEVFKSRCDLIPVLKQCRSHLVDTLKLCLSEKHQSDLDVLMRALDAGLEYVCHNGGERLALFMAEDGVNCFRDQSENMVSCLNSTASSMESWSKELDANKTAFTENACKIDNKIRMCVEDSLNKCKNPTTANLIEGLMRTMSKETPCFVNSASSLLTSFISIIAALVAILASHYSKLY